MTENQIMKQIQVACSRFGIRLFRNNVGMGWAGEATRFNKRQLISVNPGDVVIRRARPLHSGLCEGSSDLIGWREVNGIAQFCAVEVKTKTGRTTELQDNFLQTVQAAGGFGIVARSVDEALYAIDYPPRN